MEIAGWSAVVALSIGMALALIWTTSVVLGVTVLDIDQMVRTHGALNAFAVSILTLTWRA